VSERTEENPLQNYSLVSVPYGEFTEEHTDDELIIDRVREDSLSYGEDLEYEEKLALGLILENNGLDGGVDAVDGSEPHRYSFPSGEVYALSHEDSLVLVGDEELLKEKVFQEYLAPLKKS
jgi:hypothetical protein